ncbi:hypothetical protein ACODT4_44760 [Streptomyces sp. 2.9]|uniref:hypothetical protein n=1 Tax=Streptomyces tritrimontium TaxID=3406573 RepID=UPI003BB77F48
MAVPPAAAGPSPSLSFSYSSGSIDGRTANSNNQGSQVGEGFDLTSSYIERKYGSCEDDGQDDKHDLCWKYENASLVLDGKSSELVKDDTTGKWRLKDDDASQVTWSTGADNGDGNGEYWKVLTGDGTTYTFGLNKLPGAGAERTNSTWSAPVFGDDSGEPGYTKGSTFADCHETQAWRWNLDLVQDVHGNAATYWYAAETNHYAKNGDEAKLLKYTTGGTLSEIRYGQRADTLFSGTPSHKVTFGYAERCFATKCDDLTKDTSDNWPDVPFDSICSATEKECKAKGPAFFTRKRMANVKTYAWSTALEPDNYAQVDQFDLTQEYLDAGDLGDTSDQTLVLKSLKRTGKNGGTVDVPPVSSTYHMRPNRVDVGRGQHRSAEPSAHEHDHLGDGCDHHGQPLEPGVRARVRRCRSPRTTTRCPAIRCTGRSTAVTPSSTGSTSTTSRPSPSRTRPARTTWSRTPTSTRTRAGAGDDNPLTPEKEQDLVRLARLRQGHHLHRRPRQDPLQGREGLHAGHARRQAQGHHRHPHHHGRCRPGVRPGAIPAIDDDEQYAGASCARRSPTTGPPRPP